MNENNLSQKTQSLLLRKVEKKSLLFFAKPLIIFAVFLILIILFLILGVFSYFFTADTEDILNSIPQYPNSTFLSTFKTTWPDDAPSKGISFKSTNTPQKIADFYLSEMEKLGWKLVRKDIRSDSSVPTVLKFEKEKYWSHIFIGGSGSEDTIRIQVGKK